MDIVGILERIGFDGKVFLFNLINFAIIALLLQKFFFKKIVSVMEERKRIIDEGISNAEKVKQELANAELAKQKIIDDAKLEANGIVKQSVENAKEAESRILEEANNKSEEIKQRASHSVQQEKKQMLEEFKNTASELVVMATGKILSEESKNKKENLQRVNDIINSLDENK